LQHTQAAAALMSSARTQAATIDSIFPAPERILERLRQ